MITQLVVDGLAAGVLYGGFALSLVLMYRVSKLVNFAHGEIGLFGAFLCWQLASSMNAWLAALIATLVGGALSALMEWVIIRPLDARSHFSALVAMVAVFTGLNGLTAWIWGYKTKVMPTLFSDGIVEIGDAYANAKVMGSVVVVLSCCLGLYLLLRHTRAGLMIRVTSSSPESARVLGIRTARVLVATWFVAGMLGTAVAILVASKSYLDPHTMTPILVYGFAAAVLGGLDSPGGAVLAGLLIGVIENLAATYVDLIGADFKLLVALASIFVVLVLRPRGIWGSPEVSRV